MTDADLAESARPDPTPLDADRELDVLVVGGGPGGTATAFRAVEHGLSVQVIDYDDLMRRIRDYSKDKLILPGFGGGDRMTFPHGGPLISALAFEPIDKDEMCARWKALYREHGVPSRTGVELTGLEPTDGGRWRAHAWDNRGRSELTYDARFVVLAIGRGVPRRFDIPGDTEGIAFRLDDPASFVGRPACVVGGGTSAAEAVIALSNAKAAAGDPTAVHWSYRGDCMPRVSRALAEVFFTAYVGNGNIRYHPLSEPSAVVTGADRREYLSVRIDRRELAGRPAETVHLEFPKEQCIACIGEDVPEVLLETLGVPLVTGGPRGRRRAVVNRWFESRRPGVFLVGDLLSQAYLETDDFDADPAGFREVRHRGNIKSALRDAVRVADVIRQKLDGRKDDEIEVGLESGEDAEVPAGATDTGTARRAVPAAATAETADGPPAESLRATGRDLGGLAGDAFLTRILPGGVEAEEYPLSHGAVVTIGRGGCDASFADDTALSPRHASIAWVEDGWLLRDDGGATGLFYELPAGEKREVHPGDLIRCGRQFLRLDFGDGGDGDGDRPVLTHFDRQGREIGRHELTAGTIVLGRQAPDLTLDPDDRTLSRRHLAVGVEDGRVLVKDLKSANGSLLRVKGALRLRADDRFRAGAQRFRLNVSEGGDGGGAAAPAAPAAAPPPGPAGGAGAGPSAPSVEFRGTGRRLVVAPGQTLCEAAEAAGVPINAECHAGICGSDPIRILSGREHLLDTEPDDQERETLEEICEREPGEHRLACRVRARGPVEVEIL
jgi:thioredoxin reductase/ferredoxin/pSer/pThr/pTyr-binding forkhead associated (FHA) protein